MAEPQNSQQPLEAEPAAAPESTGMLQGIVDSIFTPGVNSSVVTFVLVVFVLLFIVLATLLLFVEFNIHIFVMLCLAVGLAVSLAWFLRELDAAKKSASATPATSENAGEKGKELSANNEEASTAPNDDAAAPASPTASPSPTSVSTPKSAAKKRLKAE